MKKHLLISSALLISITTALAQETLKVDFSQTDSDAIESGFEPYYATHEVPETFIQETYSAFGTDITFEPTWTEPFNAESQQMIARGEIVSEMNDLLSDWIGTDFRRDEGGYLIFTIGGLPSGQYQWTSYHHDNADQTAAFNVEINDANGLNELFDVALTNGEGDISIDTIGIIDETIVSDGSDITIQLILDAELPIPQGTRDSEAFVLCNGFVLTQLSTQTSLSDSQTSNYKVFPNPATDFLNIISMETISTVRIYDVTGSLIILESVQNGSQLDISSLSKGVYLIDINDASYTQRFVVK